MNQPQIAVSGRAVGSHRALACALGVHHQWHRYSTEDGFRYRACSRCGKDHPELGNAPALRMQKPTATD